MTLVDKQAQFANMVGKLLVFAGLRGYQITLGDAFRDPRATFPYSHPKSLHGMRLAIDLNVFLDGDLLNEKEQYLPLAQYWEEMGGTWGGRFKKVDCPHFSLAHGGMK
jgi:hypothetical protein